MCGRVAVLGCASGEGPSRDGSIPRAKRAGAAGTSFLAADAGGCSTGGKTAGLGPEVNGSWRVPGRRFHPVISGGRRRSSVRASGRGRGGWMSGEPRNPSCNGARNGSDVPWRAAGACADGGSGGGLGRAEASSGVVVRGRGGEAEADMRFKSKGALSSKSREALSSGAAPDTAPVIVWARRTARCMTSSAVHTARAVMSAVCPITLNCRCSPNPSARTTTVIAHRTKASRVPERADRPARRGAATEGAGWRMCLKGPS